MKNFLHRLRSWREKKKSDKDMLKSSSGYIISSIAGGKSPAMVSFDDIVFNEEPRPLRKDSMIGKHRSDGNKKST